MIKTG